MSSSSETHFQLYLSEETSQDRMERKSNQSIFDSDSDGDSTILIPQSQTILPPRRSPRKRAEAKRKLQELDRSDSEAEITVGETPVSCRTKEIQKTPCTTSSIGSNCEVDYTRTVVLRRGHSIQEQLRQVIQNQRDILVQLSLIKRELAEVKSTVETRKEETEQPITVPNRIRNAVKEFFSNAEDSGLSLDYQKRYQDGVNREMTDYLKKSVKGVNPDVSAEVLDVAVKRYFTTKKEAANRTAKQRDTLHKQRQATYERKKEKVRRRLLATNEKKNWTEEKRKHIRDFLQSKGSHKLMSSDEEGDDGFVSHPYSWENETWLKVKDSLDKKYLEVCPARSRRLLQRRVRGSRKDQEPPQLEHQFSWIIQ